MTPSKHQFAGERVPLGELCRPKQWKSLKQSDMTKSGFPVYGANGIIGHYSEYNHADETILIGCRGTCGEVNVCQPKSYVTSNAMCLDGLSECVDKQFLFCFLKAYDFRKVIGGTSQPQITKSGISSIEVPLFPLEDQRRITLRLLSVLKVIENRRTLLGKLDSLVKSRFVEMFGDPSICVNRWRRLRLDKFAQVITGNTPSRKCPEFYGKGIEWVKTDNIADSIVTTAAEQLTDEGRKKARIAPAGSILMACIAGSVKSIGKVGLLDREVAFNQQINAIVPGDKVDARFLLTMLSLSKTYLCSDVNQQLKGILNKSALSAKQFSLPPLILQHQFADFAASVDKSRFAGTFTGTINVKNYAISCSVHNNSGRIPNEALHSAREVTECALLELQELYDSLTQKYFAL